jgi:O-antigen/teichoic acid export membrane protein
VIDLYFQSQVQSKYVVRISLIQIIFSSILKVYLCIIKAHIIFFAVVFIIDGIVLAGGLLIVFILKKHHFNIRAFNKKIAIDILRNSWPLIAAGFVVSIYMRIDQIMLKMLINEEAVGIYAAALRLSEAWYFIPGAIISSVFPAIIASRAKSMELYHNRLQSLFDLLSLISLLVIIPMTFLSNIIIKILYGTEFIQAGPVLSIHIWTSLFVFLGIASSSWLVSENLQSISFYRSLVGVIINVILNFFLIPTYSVLGAAIATLISQACATFIFFAFSKKTRIIFIMQLKSIFIFFRLKQFYTAIRFLIFKNLSTLSAEKV